MYHAKLSCFNDVQEAQKRSGGGTIIASLAAPAIAAGKSEEDELRNLILTMVDEPVAIVIKLADRLHNMRTVWALPPAKARAVATETLRVWCSLAERLGMFAVKVPPPPSPATLAEFPLFISLLPHLFLPVGPLGSRVRPRPHSYSVQL